jgi:hypothetical protein
MIFAEADAVALSAEALGMKSNMPHIRRATNEMRRVVF